MEQFGSPNSLTTEKDIFECTVTEQEDSLTGTAIGEVVLLPPHDFFALNEEEIFDLFPTDSKNHIDIV